MDNIFYTVAGARADLVEYLTPEELNEFIPWLAEQRDLTGYDEDRRVLGFSSLLGMVHAWRARAILVGNAFSLNMLVKNSTVRIRELDLEDARAILNTRTVVSCVGHADTAAMLGATLEVDLPMNRCSVQLVEGDDMLVGQYVGPRLPEGTTTLPEGSKVVWKYISVHRY